jgi:hypothetical protein
MQCTYKRNIEGRSRSRNHRCRGSITYTECVFVALIIQRAMRMRRFILSSVACCCWCDCQVSLQIRLQLNQYIRSSPTRNLCCNCCKYVRFLLKFWGH